MADDFFHPPQYDQDAKHEWIPRTYHPPNSADGLVIQSINFDFPIANNGKNHRKQKV